MAGLKPVRTILPITGASWPGVQYGCTVRDGGVSTGHWRSFNLATHVGDADWAVRKNREHLASAAGLSSQPLWLEQVHGVTVVDADLLAPSNESHGGISDVPLADAAVTLQAGRVLAIMTADCAPVVVADLDGRAVGVAHAGWRGLAAGVIDATLVALQHRVPDSRGWQAWVGPCIGQDAFEVGDEVRQAFLTQDESATRHFKPGAVTHKWQADLAGLVCHRLETLGVYRHSTAGLCTVKQSDQFFSYRRSPITGRMATLAWLERGPDFP